MLDSEIRETARLPFSQAKAKFAAALDSGDMELAESPIFNNWCEQHVQELNDDVGGIDKDY